MLMKVKYVDFHQVEPEHAEMHARLENWAELVRDRGMHWVSPIWKLGRSHGRQWDMPKLRPPVDTHDGWLIEKAVSILPEKHRAAVRWAYVRKDAPARAARELAVSMEGLHALVRSGRVMLINRERAA